MSRTFWNWTFCVCKTCIECPSTQPSDQNMVKGIKQQQSDSSNGFLFIGQRKTQSSRSDAKPGEGTLNLQFQLGFSPFRLIFQYFLVLVTGESKGRLLSHGAWVENAAQHYKSSFQRHGKGSKKYKRHFRSVADTWILCSNELKGR